MTVVWDKVSKLAADLTEKFNSIGTVVDNDAAHQYGWHNTIWTSDRFRRAHVEIVDFRETYNIYILHCTVFPHFNDPSPIFGFDAVCGKSKITGAFHDYSNAGDPHSAMYTWFRDRVGKESWNKPRELPEWARAIFSPSMVAAGNLREEVEIDQLCNLAKETLDFYLKNVGKAQQDTADFHMAQNRYCHYQKQNPQVVRSMVAMGIEEVKIKRFVEEVLFPEIH
jgi:hypothetical protein